MQIILHYIILYYIILYYIILYIPQGMVLREHHYLIRLNYRIALEGDMEVI